MHSVKYGLVLFLFTCLNLAAGTRHPLHVSTTEINYNAKEKALEISCKIFTDDFEAILAKVYKQKIDLARPELKKNMDELVKKYLISHLHLNANGKAVPLDYIGFEIDHEATNIYLEVGKVSFLKVVSVKNTILYDQFDDQMSILHIVKGNTRKSTKILYPNQTFTANF